jgi:hypothetical protein
MRKMIAVATKHGKLAQIQPAFALLPEWELKLAEIDTDQFGTFSGEVPRALSPKETAIEKAKAGARSLGLDYGLASEGTIGPHPHIPFINADTEILALVCLSKDFAVVETFVSTEIFAKSLTVTLDSDLEAIALEMDAPNHAVNVYLGKSKSKILHKGISSSEEFITLVSQSLEALGEDLLVESDFRAMNSPSRQANIAACAEKLVKRISSCCPECQEIGWGKVGYEYGLPCIQCDQVSQTAAHSEVYGCVACPHKELVPLGVESIDPSRCDSCNP